MKRIVCFLLVLILALSLSISALADGTEYTYTVRVYAGNMGTINGSNMIEVSGIPYGAEWSFDIGQVKLTNDKYYVRGIRESGLDNDMVSSAAFKVERDMDFVVAYGIKGSEVAYTVSFVRDSDGAELAPSVTYYGNVGDKPVVACKFIDGYYPRYYNITGTLSENAASNQFVFRYARKVVARITPTPVPALRPTPVPGTNNTLQPTVPVTQTPNPGTTHQSPQNTDSGNTQNQPGAEPQPGTEFPSEPEVILDLDVPMAGPIGNAESANHTPAVRIVLGAIAALAVLFALWYVFFFRKKKNDETE